MQANLILLVVGIVLGVLAIVLNNARLAGAGVVCVGAAAAV